MTDPGEARSPRRTPGLPILRWLPDWRRPGVIRADLFAGLTGAVVVLPQGLAFATLAGMPPQYGLYAAMVPCIVAALFGSSRLMVTGPANAISLTTAVLVAPLAAVGSAEYVRLVLTLSFMVGALQLLLGLARFGALIDKVPHSVIVGFVVGAAVLIVNSQIGPLLGIEMPRGLSVVANVQTALSRIDELNPLALFAGLVTMALAVAARPWSRVVPAMLVAVIGGALATHVASALWAQGAMPPTVKALPEALPPLSAPDLSLDVLRTLLGATLVMTLLALTEAVAIAKAIARRHGDVLDGNREFIGQGLANLAGSFFSAYPASGSFNRSAVNVASGARTPLAAISAAVLLIVGLPFVAPLIRHLPFAVLAGLLFVVACNLVDTREVARICREERREILPLVVTAVATVSVSLEAAILIGLVTAWLARLGR